MADDDSGRPKRRNTGTRGKLRRSNNIESVIVEETFSLALPNDASSAVRSEVGANHESETHAGDGCYVSATSNNRRYYGVLIEQAALRAASLLHFQDEASSLDLNRRMKMLRERNSCDKHGDTDSGSIEGNGVKRSISHLTDDTNAKRMKVADLQVSSSAAIQTTAMLRVVQKFRYVDPIASKEASGPGYRFLLATYASVDAAAEDDIHKAQLIERACQSGGDFVGDYYYQYEAGSHSLETTDLSKPTDIGVRTSMGFDSFLHSTALPVWFPLSNHQTGQHKVLSMLQLKKNHKGVIEWDAKAADDIDAAGSDALQGTHIPMEPRSHFRVGIIGGGIAGLACAHELLQQAERENVNIEVVLLEGRSRLGGRLYTDESTFKCSDGVTPFPVDLGASWIHGIEHNPLAALAKEAGATFVTASEEVKMLSDNMTPVDKEMDERTGKLFDDLLDQAADDCWEADDYVTDEERNQSAVRWYAATLKEEGAMTAATDAPQHRHSSDVSMDCAIGRAIAKHKSREFSKLSQEEHNLLLWNTKNVEYALGANVSDLSMKFWDSDERHAFEGDHVLLTQGYSLVVRHLLSRLMEKIDRFKCVTDFPVGKVEYSRKSTTHAYPDGTERPRKLVELSDACCITSQRDDQSYKFDFVVCTLPLGVLKESVADDAPTEQSVIFQPQLPFPKRDAICNVGFGLLNKVYLQFPFAFWRDEAILDEDQTLFGNVSGFNPQHYMFVDIGKSLGDKDDAPAVLMTLISGKEAVEAERLTDGELVEDVLETLYRLFTETVVPDPLASRITRWGEDPFSRGCYTFLPPGATDQDFQMLQSPINGNGDSLLLEGSETMRLFWAGEHTTSLHPSMAHGAMLSGIRAAKEIIATMHFNYLDARSGNDKLIPLAIFRKKNLEADLKCSLCHRAGSRVREGSLLAFQRGSRQVLVHNNCAENSPEVEVRDGRWKSVIRAINRGKQINCTLCGKIGATIGCTHENCFRSYHFSCGEDTGWRFERDGKVFFCDQHRTGTDDNGQLLYGLECDLISLQYFRTKNPAAMMKCSLCGMTGDDKESGSLLAFQQRNQQVLVHDKCARFTTIVDTVEETDVGDKFRNIFEAIHRAKLCMVCMRHGGTIACAEASCDRHFHFKCSEDTGWDFRKKGKVFLCEQHRGNYGKKQASVDTLATNKSLFQHNLFCRGAATVLNGNHKKDTPQSRPQRIDLPSGAHTSAVVMSATDTIMLGEMNTPESDTDESVSSADESATNMMTQPLSCDMLSYPNGFAEFVRIKRPSLADAWNLSFCVVKGRVPGTHALSVERNADANLLNGLEVGDILVSINGVTLGSKGLLNLHDVLRFLRGGTDAMICVHRQSNR